MFDHIFSSLESIVIKGTFKKEIFTVSSLYCRKPLRALFIESVQWSPSPSSGRYLHRATRSTWNSAKLLTLLERERHREIQVCLLQFSFHLKIAVDAHISNITVRYFSDSHILVRNQALGQNCSSSFDLVKQLTFLEDLSASCIWWGLFGWQLSATN